MTNVTINWIKQNVEKLHGFGGQITLENFEEYVRGQKTLQTTLSRRGIQAVELCDYVTKFNILIPSVGWAEAWGYSNESQKLEIDEV